MSTKLTYEAFEALLRKKSWEELSPEEQASVQDFADSREAFDHMRNLLLGMDTAIPEDPVIEPKAETKDKLLERFQQVQQAQAGKTNTIAEFFIRRPVYRNPLAQFAAAAMLILASIFILDTAIKDQTREISQKKEQIKKNETEGPVEKVKEEAKQEQSKPETEEKSELNTEAEKNDYTEKQQEESAVVEPERKAPESPEKVDVDETSYEPEYQPGFVDGQSGKKRTEEVKEEPVHAIVEADNLKSIDKKTTSRISVTTMAVEEKSKMTLFKNEKYKTTRVQSSSLADYEGMIDLLYTAM